MKKKYIIIALIVVVIAILVTALIYTNKNNNNDANKFSKEYTQVSKDNVFVYRDAEEIINILEKGTGIVFLGFPECKWCQRYAKYLNEVALDQGIEKIYYYNIKNDREDNSKNYQKIVSILEENLDNDEEGKPRIYVPDVSFVKKGEILYHDNETSMESGEPDEYWTEDKIVDLKARLYDYMIGVNPNICKDGCNE